jgi:hypothetical protein
MIVVGPVGRWFRGSLAAPFFLSPVHGRVTTRDTRSGSLVNPFPCPPETGATPQPWRSEAPGESSTY